MASHAYIYSTGLFSPALNEKERVQMVQYKISVLQSLTVMLWEQNVANSACSDFR